MDVSPCADGTIPMLQQERLVQMGDWLKVNGEADLRDQAVERHQRRADGRVLQSSLE